MQKVLGTIIIASIVALVAMIVHLNRVTRLPINDVEYIYELASKFSKDDIKKKYKCGDDQYDFIFVCIYTMATLDLNGFLEVLKKDILQKESDIIEFKKEKFERSQESLKSFFTVMYKSEMREMIESSQLKNFIEHLLAVVQNFNPAILKNQDLADFIQSYYSSRKNDRILNKQFHGTQHSLGDVAFVTIIEYIRSAKL